MSKRHRTKAWQSEDELLKDTPDISAKQSEATFSGDAKILDEDALLAVDESGMRSSPFTTTPAVGMTTRQRSRGAVGHQGTVRGTRSAVIEPSLVLEDTAISEAEKNMGGHLTNTNSTLHDEEMSDVINSSEQLCYGDGTDIENNVIGLLKDDDAIYESEEYKTEFKQEQPMDQEEQLENSGNCENEGKNGLDSSLDSEQLKNERTGVISLTPTTRRESIPDKLEINKEQAAQLKQFLSDKSHRGRGKTRGLGRPNSNSLLGTRPVGIQQNPQALLGQLLQGVLGPQPRMGFPFPGGPPNRGPFSAGPFPGRPLNQRVPFSGRPQNQRGSFAGGTMNMPLRGTQSGPVLNLPHGRFIGTPNQRGLFPGPQSAGPLRMSTGPQPLCGLPPNQLRLQGFPNQRMVNPNQFRQQPPLFGQQGIRPPQGMPGPRPLIGNAGPRPSQGMSGPRPLIGNVGPRPLLGNGGPRPLLGNGGSRSLLGNPGPVMRFGGTNRPPGNPQLGQSIVNQVANALKSSLRFQQMRPGQPNPLMMSNANNRPLGPMQNANRFQNPIGQPQGPPRFMGRGGPFVNSPMFRGNQQSLLGGQRMQMVGNHKIFINPRFQGPQAGFGATGMGRTFRMGIPAHQRRAKVLLEKAKQTQNKNAITTPAKLTGIKRKSTGGEDVPNKVGKLDENTPENSETTPVQPDIVC